MEKEKVIDIYSQGMLYVRDDEVDRVVKKFNETLNFIEPILEVDTTGVEMAELAVEHDAKLRKDEVKESLDRDQALKNAKDTEFGYFRLNWEL
ncbi:MAG: Asp-tRNA(Asn)/Glu-tRNA(Gln) amidotransferase subunit GatC [Tissierellia bacterium]|nr:Asp-tRNA(Asn)/Glu-tRNA(Gln) amidotransferase subunit GatC [Tissierellia bacterium]